MQEILTFLMILDHALKICYEKYMHLLVVFLIELVMC